MSANIRTLLTIISESSLENRLVRDVQKLGARGYTITECRGKGARGARDAEWDYDSNIRMEVICSRETALAIEKWLQEKYYDDFAIVVYSDDVNVLRPDKF
ncbi:MAG: transcriptional regulator [Gammaproteobacteria bacterium]|nr:transcriptional regulator [Gammaproteobacteria bacterium]